MLEKIESAFRDLLNALQTVKLYDTAHPSFKKSLDKAYASLQEALKDRAEFVIGIVGEELAFENEILFELSKTVHQTVLYLKDRGIERIAFSQGFLREELEKFIIYLALPKAEIKGQSEEYLKLAGVRNIVAGKLKEDTTSQDTAKIIQKGFALKMYESSLKNASQSITDILEEAPLDSLALRFSINQLLENFTAQYQKLLEIVNLKRYSLETYVHLLNVAVLSMYFSQKLGLSRDDVLDISMSGLFHDIGKLYISRKVLKKTGKLTTEEFSQIKSHAILGAEILLKYTEALGILPATVALEHHLKFDLSGYPRLAFSHKPHTASMIISICDVYDALSQRRGYKLDYAPNLIHEIMAKQEAAAFDPQLLEVFFKIMGVWPVGAIVSLSDGTVAVVRSENEDDIFSPNIEVIAPQQNKEIIDLREKRGVVKIERYLNPWKEGQGYLHQLESEL